MPPKSSKSTSDHSTITTIEQEYLIYAYHSTRQSQSLSHNDASRSPMFWSHIANQMSLRGCKKAATGWQYNWQQMFSKLLVRIEKARRLKRTDSSWLTLLNSHLLAVLLDALDVEMLNFVESCLSEDVRDEDDQLIVCATVYRYATSDRFVMRCQHCRQTFEKADEMLAHIRRYYDDVGSGMNIDSSSDEDESMVDDDICDESQSQEDPHHSIEPVIESTEVSLVALDNASVISDQNASCDTDKTNRQKNNESILSMIDDDSSDSFKEFLREHKSTPPLRAEYAAPLDEKQIISCTVEGCPAIFYSNDALVKHTLSVHDRRPFQCPRCPRTLRSKGLLSLHLIDHERRLQCDICKRFFPNIKSIANHMHIHANATPFKCAGCDLWFRHHSQRRNHWQQVHGGGFQRPFVCEKCGMKFRFRGGLKEHSLTHSDERPLKCALCDAGFRRKENLAVHVQRMHTADRPFTCRHEGCSIQYRNSETRLRHEERVHGGSGAAPRTVLCVRK